MEQSRIYSNKSVHSLWPLCSLSANLLCIQPHFVEEALDTVDPFVWSTRVDVIIYDRVILVVSPGNQVYVCSSFDFVTSFDLDLAYKSMTMDKILVVKIWGYHSFVRP